jgi:N-methylhydantoinase A
LIDKGPTKANALDEGILDVVRSTVSPEDLAEAEWFLHGTTVGLNALLQAIKGSAHSHACFKII